MLKAARHHKPNSGFTLLEVMIAITIMAVAFGAILVSQSSGINRTISTKERNIGGWLAHKVMVESEHLYEGKPFEELSKLDTKKFEEPFQRYAWKREIREIKFPDITAATASKDGQGVPETVRMLSKTITKFFNDSIREMVITVSWPHGDGEQKITLTTYLINLNVDINPSGI
jgi:prepilin-type N-terminal cleavage/methylation domain-containing protein